MERSDDESDNEVETAETDEDSIADSDEDPGWEPSQVFFTTLYV